MGSSGGGGSSAGLLALLGQGNPTPNLPVAGSEGAVGDPFEYGKFQNFLPAIKAEGVNDMATGLRPEMFNYTSPNPNGGDPAAASAGRDALAAVAAGSGGGGSSGGSGSIGTMGLGGMGGMGPYWNGVAPIPGAQQLPTPRGGWAAGNVPGWPSGGQGTPRVVPGVNTDPAAAAAALAAAKASGG